MFRQMLQFWRGLSTNWVGAAGVVLTTSAFVLFLLAEALRLAGAITNAYVGLITYLLLPSLFVLGLLLIPAGWWLYKRRRGKSSREILSERFAPDMIEPRPLGARLYVIIGLLTLVNIAFLAAGGARMLHFMNQPRFCGTACHSVMGPEWAAYQASPHARVRCVDCHVGQGLDAELDAKLNGVWQMISVTFDLYERPIPTPVHNLRPARETCETCHWPDAFYGDRVKRIVHFERDRASTPRHTTLSLKVGSGKGEQRGQIHWHIAAQNQVRYQPVDRQRLELRWVEVRRPDGGYHRYTNRSLDASLPEDRQGGDRHDAGVRVLDCVDCHNRATHRFQDPEEAIDELLASGYIPRALPFAKRRALAALIGSYPPGQGAVSVERDFRGSYRDGPPGRPPTVTATIDRAVESLRRTWEQNIHSRMRVGWNPYPDHLGHQNGPGCRRCHGPHMVDRAGEPVPHRCTLCHSILAWDSASPFRFLEPPAPGDPLCTMHSHLQSELTGRTSGVACGEAVQTGGQ